MEDERNGMEFGEDEMSDDDFLGEEESEDF